jgi:phasin family protein
MFLMNDQITNMFKQFQPANEQFANMFKNMFSVNGQYPASSGSPFFGNEQFTNAVKASVETQVSFLTKMSASTLGTVEKIVELNVSAAKATMEDSTVIAKQLLASKDGQEVQALLGALPQSISAKATAYSRHVADIASAAQADLTRAAEQQFAESGLRLSALMDQVSRNMPAGSETSFAMAKTVIASASAGYEQFNKKAQQAGEAVRAQVSNAADNISQVAGQVPGTGIRVQ